MPSPARPVLPRPFGSLGRSRPAGVALANPLLWHPAYISFPQTMLECYLSSGTLRGLGLLGTVCMRRREFIILLGGGATAWPHSALAQVSTKRPLIAWLSGGERT